MVLNKFVKSFKKLVKSKRIHHGGTEVTEEFNILYYAYGSQQCLRLYNL
jgi:hypothetical protein